MLITDRKVCLTFAVRGEERPLGNRRVAQYLNFATIASTKASAQSEPRLEGIKMVSIRRISQIQNDFSRKRQRNRKLRTYLNRWPYRLYQLMVEYKSNNHTIYVSPRGTSSECLVCGDRLEHPEWVVSRCNKCGVDYGRDRLASLAMLCRGMRLCGQPFAMSADASWQQMKVEYLHLGSRPDDLKTGWTDAANAPNSDVYMKVRG